MQTFLAVLCEESGCDRTVECGTTTYVMRENSIEAARARVARRIADFRGEHALHGAYLYEITSSEKLDVKAIYQEIEKAEALQKEEARRATELAELARLKALYES